MPAPPRQAVGVEEHVEGDVLPVRRGDHRARARTDEDRGHDAQLLAGLEHAEVGEAARGAPGADERDLQLRHRTIVREHDTAACGVCAEWRGWKLEGAEQWPK